MSLLRPAFLIYKESNQTIWLLLQQHYVGKDVKNVCSKLRIYRHEGYKMKKIPPYYKRFFCLPTKKSNDRVKDTTLLYSSQYTSLEKILSDEAGYFTVVIDIVFFFFLFCNLNFFIYLLKDGKRKTYSKCILYC
jgi:hypothetical protein